MGHLRSLTSDCYESDSSFFLSPFFCQPSEPHQWRAPMSWLLLLVLIGCQEAKPVATPAAPTATAKSDPKPHSAAATAEASPHESKRLTAHIHFKDDAGQQVYELKPEPNGAKLVGSGEQEIARYHISDHTLKIKDAHDTVLGHIVRHDDHYKIEDAERQTVLFKIAAQSDGDWTVEDGAQKRLYRIKKRDYGFEIESPSKESLAKVKLKEGKLSLRNSQDVTLFSTKDHTSTLGFTSLGLDQIASVPVRMGLLLLMTINDRH